MRLVTGSKGDFKRETSFLSSIEICIIECAEVLYMQNWTHLEEIFQTINKMPKYSDITNDIFQIREYFLENLGNFFRQTLIFSEYQFPELNSLRIRHLQNYKV